MELCWGSENCPHIRILWSLLLLGLSYRSASVSVFTWNLPAWVQLEESLPLPWSYDQLRAPLHLRAFSTAVSTVLRTDRAAGSVSSHPLEEGC